MVIYYKKNYYEIPLKIVLRYFFLCTILFLKRIKRFSKRAIKQFVKFLPVAFALFSFIVLLFIVGYIFRWYKSFYDTLMDMKYFALSVFFTTYILAFIVSIMGLKPSP
jgi:Kef-type K+ transport system membrane component KefB